MASKKNGKAKRVSPIPRGYRTVTATMNQNDSAATIAFCKKAFGAKLRSKMAGPGGKLMHAEMEIGDSIVMLSDAMQEPARVASMFLYVDNVDKTFAKALKAGAKVVMPLENQFWGDRHGRIADPQGNLWAIASRVEKLSPTEMKKRMKAETKRMKAMAK
jgi:PhnB protein